MKTERLRMKEKRDNNLVKVLSQINFILYGMSLLLIFYFYICLFMGMYEDVVTLLKINIAFTLFNIFVLLTIIKFAYIK